MQKVLYLLTEAEQNNCVIAIDFHNCSMLKNIKLGIMDGWTGWLVILVVLSLTPF